ncbi:hypothetical protein Trydic_g19324 [Trypoxylus dichotomus]
MCKEKKQTRRTSPRFSMRDAEAPPFRTKLALNQASTSFVYVRLASRQISHEKNVLHPVQQCASFMPATLDLRGQPLSGSTAISHNPLL